MIASILGWITLLACAQSEGVAEVRKTIDDYFDGRWEGRQGATGELVGKIRKAGLDLAGVEKILREGRASYPEPPQSRGTLTLSLPLKCEHLDFETVYLLYVPKSYDGKKAGPLVLLGHGGSTGRSRDFGIRAALGGMLPYKDKDPVWKEFRFRWTDEAEKHGFLLAAPITEVGWGSIGYAVVFSLLSKLQREYRIDPDRVYVTGHSMGGHLSYRSGIYLPDRWGAVSPMSGGYDYVKSKEVHALFDVPGYATFGSDEPFEINVFNRKIRDWMKEHGYPWVVQEKKGGHEIFEDEIPNVSRFFTEHPRDLFRKTVFARGGGPMAYDDANDKRYAWKKERPIPASTFHWVRLIPREDALGQSVWAVNEGNNSFTLVTENVRKLRLYLHDRMVDFSKPVRITVNGTQLFEERVTRDVAAMLELAREFDDRGRIFHAAVDLTIQSDRPVPEPSFK